MLFLSFLSACSQRTSIYSEKYVKICIFKLDAHLTVSCCIPVTRCFHDQTSFRSSLLFLHHLNYSHILEIWIISLKRSHQFFVCLGNPSWNGGLIVTFAPKMLRYYRSNYLFLIISQLLCINYCLRFLLLWWIILASLSGCHLFYYSDDYF